MERNVKGSPSHHPVPAPIFEVSETVVYTTEVNDKLIFSPFKFFNHEDRCSSPLASQEDFWR
jgi:hypothetical protein